MSKDMIATGPVGKKDRVISKEVNYLQNLWGRFRRIFAFKTMRRLGIKIYNSMRHAWRHPGKMIISTSIAASTVVVVGSFLTYAHGLTLLEIAFLFFSHTLLSSLFLLLLWWPLMKCREAWIRSRDTMRVALVFAILLTPIITILFPREPLIQFMSLTVQGKIIFWFSLIGINLFCGVVFFSTFGSFIWRKSENKKTTGRPQRNYDERLFYPYTRPGSFFGAISFFIGLYFVCIIEFWSVNVLYSISYQHVFKHGAVPENFIFYRVDHGGNIWSNEEFLPDIDWMKFLQPYDHPPLLFGKTVGDSLKGLQYPALHGIVEHARSGVKPITIHQSQPVAATLTAASADVQPPSIVLLPNNPSPSDKISLLFPLFSVVLAGAFALFFGAVIPLRVLAFVLPPVWHNAGTYNKRLQFTLVYRKQFYLAVLAANPLLAITGSIAMLFLIIMPIYLVVAHQVASLKELVSPDVLIFIVTLVAAWISPIAVAGVYVDRTFGTYFNTKLSNLILSMRDHVVFLGYGDLGRRIVDRQLRLMERNERNNWYESVVSPDLHVEKLCTGLIIVERNSDYFLFSATNDFLGVYGVVAAGERPHRSDAFVLMNTSQLSRRPPLKHTLVPVVSGNATEPYTLSRVNLERAHFLISMVSEDEHIYDVFKRTTQVGLQAVICVSRSDQINYITYKAVPYPVWLVYPKENQGAAIGQRLFAAVLKCHSHLSKSRKFPYILVIGSNKSSHFMLEHLWGQYPVVPEHKKARLFEESIRFISTISPKQLTKPYKPRKEEKKTVFDQLLSSSFVSTARHHVPATSPHPEVTADIRTCVLPDDPSMVLNLCLTEFMPDIVVINDDSAEKSRMLLLQAMTALERIKHGNANFELPLLLLGSARGEDEEKQVLGDAMQYYNGLSKLYEDPALPGYPRPSRFRRRPEPRRLMGDRINDSVADTEEVITGIYDMISHCDRGETFELNTCIPNSAGILAVLVARLAGLNLTGGLDKATIQNFKDNGFDRILRPNFQYLRHIRFPMSDGLNFSFTGFAELQDDELQELNDEAQALNSNTIAMRAFVRDNRNYLAKPPAAGDPVPELLKRVAGKDGNILTVPQFIDALHGSDFVKGASASMQRSEKMCPAMDICPIASYQKYILATNGDQIHQFWQDLSAGKHNVSEIKGAPNYHCADMPLSSKVLSKKRKGLPSFARLFCCCHSDKDEPGLLAIAMNTLVFRRVKELRDREQREDNIENDWVANFFYFKDIACDNRAFSLNCLFGSRRYTSEVLKDYGNDFDKYENAMKSLEPIRLIQILPVGDEEVARQWFAYAVVLFNYLNRFAAENEEKSRSAIKYTFSWWDQYEKRHDGTTLPKGSDSFPIAIQIQYARDKKNDTDVLLGKSCEYCECQEPMEGCARIRSLN